MCPPLRSWICAIRLRGAPVEIPVVLSPKLRVATNVTSTGLASDLQPRAEAVRAIESAPSGARGSTMAIELRWTC